MADDFRERKAAGDDERPAAGEGAIEARCFRAAELRGDGGGCRGTAGARQRRAVERHRLLTVADQDGLAVDLHRASMPVNVD